MSVEPGDTAPVPPAPPEPPLPAPKKRGGALPAFGVLIGIGVVVLVIVLAVNRTAKMTVTGTFELHDATSAGAGCHGADGYGDIDTNTQVTITSDGKTLGFTQLGAGKADGATCTWTWSIAGVPKDHKIYAVEVGRRGSINYSEKDLELGLAGVTLGSG